MTQSFQTKMTPILNKQIALRNQFRNFFQIPTELLKVSKNRVDAQINVTFWRFGQGFERVREFC